MGFTKKETDKQKEDKLNAIKKELAEKEAEIAKLKAEEGAEEIPEEPQEAPAKQAIAQPTTAELGDIVEANFIRGLELLRYYRQRVGA